MNTNDLTPELKARAMACKTPEELLALAEKVGVELSEEQLSAVSGGAWTCDDLDLTDFCPTNL